MRRHSTRAEDILWRSLRGSRLQGAKFRRQLPSILMPSISIVLRRSVSLTPGA
ncbi:MAG TPA: DUF559 domain-containing protein [Bradyrhizobium sp.]|nr:DUF559 domain-containing protein [Bradyrhizobium sp.]